MKSKSGGTPGSHTTTANGRQRRRRGKPARPESHAREATLKSLDTLGLTPSGSSTAVPSRGALPAHGTSKRGKARKRSAPSPALELPYPLALRAGSGVGGTVGGGDDDEGASSGDEYSGNLLATYIGQIGACAALGLPAGAVLNSNAWDALSHEERDSLMVHLPASLPHAARDALARRVLDGAQLYFGSPRDRAFTDVAAGLTHPRVRRWRLRVSLIERRHHLMSLRDFHNRGIRRLLARKAATAAAAPLSPLAGVAAVGGNLTKSGGALQALPNRIQATAEAAVQSGVNNEWDEERWRRVLDFRNQETLRYKMPERAFRYRNPWGDSIVGPLKRGPALDGGRPREHGLLRNERPSHVTILCIVRDAASRLPRGRGTRGDICDLLRDSQYVREGATYQMLNSVVSGALDRLHYEESAPVKYDAESKEWVYLHNHFNEDDFERPAWARETAQRHMASGAGPVGQQHPAQHHPVHPSAQRARQGKRRRRRSAAAEE